MRTDYIPEELLMEIIGFMKPENRLVIRVLMHTGMRIGDLLNQRWEDWKKVLDGKGCWIFYKEQKTGKMRQIRPDNQDLWELSRISRGSSPWLFPGRDPAKHRTRQAVWKDLHQVSQLYRVDGKRLCRRLGSHTARKVYAVRRYWEAQRDGEMDALAVVQEDLNHADRTVTFLYALADVITASRVGEKM